MADLQRISDRLDIEDLLTKYAFFLDDRDFDALKELFVPGARMDYEASGGIAGERDAVVEWLRETVSAFPMSEHVVTNRLVTVDGDEASSRSYLYNPMQLPGGKITFLGGRYHDRFTRTPDGWRFAERRIDQITWTDGWD
jgi:3-phenylpropionate/cinnamic acid dioxygenase small subunit